MPVNSKDRSFIQLNFVLCDPIKNRILFQSFARMIKFLTLLEKIFERLVTLRGNQRSLLRRGTPIKNVTSYCVSGCKRPNCHLVSKSNWLILRFWLSDDAAVSTSSLNTANNFCVCVKSEGGLRRLQQFWMPSDSRPMLIG